MFQILQFFVVFLLILHNFEYVNGDKYQCHLVYHWWCDLKDLKLTRDNYEIVPVAANLSAVERIFLNGTVPVLSAKDICKAMPNLKWFEGDKISLEEIPEEAFENCNKLEELYLRDNQIFKIGRNSFKGLSNLKDLWISDGNLPTFDTDLTDSKKLTWLRLNHLNIVNFRAEILREQTNLEELDIHSNNLFDLNIEEIIKNKPNLKKIYLNDNNFKCSRLTEILNLLKNKNIQAPAIFFEGRVRSYTPNKINGIMCLTDEQWESEFVKLPLEQQLLHKQEMDIRKPKLTSLIIEKVEVLETKLNDALKTMRNKSLNLLEIRNEKFLNLQNEQNDNLEANLNKDLKSLETKMESKLENHDGKISKVTETLETFTTKVDGQITEITKTLVKLNAKIDAQDAINLKLQENMNKLLETLSNLLINQSSINNMIDQKIKSLKDEPNEAV